MPSRLWIHRLVAGSGLALLSVGCSDKSPIEPGAPAESPLAELVVSDPSLPSQPSSVAAQAGSARASVASEEGEVTYVSLLPGSVPNAISLTIRNVTTGGPQTPPIPFFDGGLDPIPVVARAGDELEIRITVAGGATTLYRRVVPKRSPPRVVRTNPPKGMIDVALNSRVLVVFTEPVSSATLTTATVRLLGGTTVVPGTVRLVAGSLFEAEFVPDEELASGTAYRIVVTQGILDADGDSLETAVTADFTTLPAPGMRFTSIVAGGVHTCALRVDGKLLCWGANWAGQLGAGSQVRDFGACPWENIPSNYNPFPCSNAPVTVVGGHAFASLTLGQVHTCGLTVSGEAFCWGNDARGELGTDQAISYCNRDNPGNPSPPDNCSGVPLRVAGGLRFSSVVAGEEHTCAIRVGEAAYCWGFGLDGALGTGHSGIVAFPAEVLGGLSFSSLTSGAAHTCGLNSSGAAYCWGVNEAGQLGNGGASSDRCTGEYLGRGSGVYSVSCAKAPELVNGGHTFASLAAGVYHTCGLTTSGRAYCWGTMATVFDSTADTFVPSPAGSYGAAPTPVSGDLVFVSLSNNPTAAHTCGVTSANVAYCWGENSSGQLGDGSQTSTLAPVRVAGDFAFSALAGGGGHSCGLTTGAILYCWGENFAGQLGVGNNASAGSLRPIRVLGQ